MADLDNDNSEKFLLFGFGICGRVGAFSPSAEHFNEPGKGFMVVRGKPGASSVRVVLVYGCFHPVEGVR